MIPLVSTRSTTTTTTYSPESTTNHRGRRSVRRLFGGSPPTFFRPSARPPRPPLRLSSQASSSKRPCDWLGPMPVETKPMLTGPGLSAIHPIPSRSTRPRARRPRGPSAAAAAALPNQNLNRGAADHLHLGPFHSQLFPHGSAFSSGHLPTGPARFDCFAMEAKTEGATTFLMLGTQIPLAADVFILCQPGVADLFRIDPESLAGGLRGWWHRGSKPSSLPPRGNGDQGEKSHTGG
ncbi:hypothetical protein CPLU01_07627 [Colletotrichum plurivorum]|uniref:Uncharacterized protein n=1 Tax=Colletotrichum plurivorum TaxID=2175906 RepID=A0A8H6NDZ1_9PEZI|nr:hypothetical protein CPLU01_07627 [Colletotrichum plurivorum]